MYTLALSIRFNNGAVEEGDHGIANTYFQLSDYKVIVILEMFVVYTVRLIFCVLLILRCCKTEFYYLILLLSLNFLFDTKAIIYF